MRHQGRERREGDRGGILEIPFDPGHYRYSLLLDDVGNRVPRPDEAFDQPHPERRVSPDLPRRQLKIHC
ncbi:hypothetical protein TRIUR3_13570 [Triticum urartu]|uniref:Uncharacterized protein n=1 Tax=Triticum urartu TaxID=4572 RepID=M8AAX0_TRIUA|nr:hypothetical protein TRIUR3_13570 [Triticum urartu]